MPKKKRRRVRTIAIGPAWQARISTHLRAHRKRPDPIATMIQAHIQQKAEAIARELEELARKVRMGG